MPSPKSTKSRRREVHRETARWWDPAFAFVRRRGVSWAISYVVLFGLGATLVIVPSLEYRGWRAGQLATSAVVSRAEFEVQDKTASEQRQLVAAEEVPPPFALNGTYLTGLRNRLQGLQAFMDNDTVESIPPTALQGVELTQAALEELHRYRQYADPARVWTEDTQAFFRRLASVPVVKDVEYELISEHKGVWSPSVRGVGDSLGLGDITIGQTIYRLGADRDALTVRVREMCDESFSPSLAAVVQAMIVGDREPFYELNRAAYATAQEAARNDPANQIMSTIYPGRLLISPGDRINESQLILLDLESRAFAQGKQNRWLWLSRFGVLTLCMGCGLGLWGYLYAFRRRIVENPTRGVAMLVTLLLALAAATNLTAADPSYLFATATLPTMLVAMIFCVVYDQRTALAMSVMHGFLLVVALRLPPSFALVILGGVGVAVAMLPDVRSRSQMLRVGLAAGATMAGLSIAAMAVSYPIHLPEVRGRIPVNALLAGVSGIAAGMIVHALISLDALERMFSVTTALTLKDLNDASHPLLQRLAQDAPGTYQHSLRIADMAEAGAEAIGADGLLCRVGAMYHDIGKVNKPQYFIENQAEGPNRHQKLSPAMSLLIIVGHVKDGIEMARQARLPQQIRHFIESHHGTTLVEYFYHAAKTKSESEHSGEVDEFQFRYPGPKPQTREAGIMLLCDATEAAARSLDEPTAVRLEQLVRAISKKRLMDGQFDDCPLTLADLARVEDAITKILCAAYHGRIKYPTADISDDSAVGATPPGPATTTTAASA